MFAVCVNLKKVYVEYTFTVLHIHSTLQREISWERLRKIILLINKSMIRNKLPGTYITVCGIFRNEYTSEILQSFVFPVSHYVPTQPQTEFARFLPIETQPLRLVEKAVEANSNSRAASASYIINSTTSRLTGFVGFHQPCLVDHMAAEKQHGSNSKVRQISEAF